MRTQRRTRNVSECLYTLFAWFNLLLHLISTQLDYGGCLNDEEGILGYNVFNGTLNPTQSIILGRTIGTDKLIPSYPSIPVLLYSIFTCPAVIKRTEY